MKCVGESCWKLEHGAWWRWLRVGEFRAPPPSAYLWSLPREMTPAGLSKLWRRLYRHSRSFCREALYILVVFLTLNLIYVLVHRTTPLDSSREIFTHHPSCTACGHRMDQRKFKETKQQPAQLGQASSHFLWPILCPQAVQL